MFSLQEMVESFKIDGISKSPAIFDTAKLRFLNGEYIRALTPEQFHDMALPWIRKGVAKEDVDTKLLASLLQPRCEILGDIPEQLDFIDALPDYSTELFVSKKMKTNEETSLEVLRAILPVLEGLDDFSETGIHGAMFALIEQLGCKNGYLLWPLRIAVSGKQFTPGGGIEIAAILGKDESLARIQTAISKLENR